jgi:hypothetical protein
MTPAIHRCVEVTSRQPCAVRGRMRCHTVFIVREHPCACERLISDAVMMPLKVAVTPNLRLQELKDAGIDLSDRIEVKKIDFDYVGGACCACCAPRRCHSAPPGGPDAWNGRLSPMKLPRRCIS